MKQKIGLQRVDWIRTEDGPAWQATYQGKDCQYKKTYPIGDLLKLCVDAWYLDRTGINVYIEDRLWQRILPRDYYSGHQSLANKLQLQLIEY